MITNDFDEAPGSRVPDDRGSKPVSGLARDSHLAVRARIQARVLRFESGNLGDHKNVGEGVFETRLDFGPGYRIYFGRQGGRVILLLTGGDKSSQTGDIRTARRYWAEYLEATKHGKAQ